MAAISIASAVIQIVVYFVGNFDVPGWASLLATVSFIGGIQLFFLGVVGEYVGLIFDEVKNRPRYVLDRHYRGERVSLAGDSRSGVGRESGGGDKGSPGTAS